MATALVLEADGRRENGRWKRGSVDNQGFLNSDWKNKISQAGTVNQNIGWFPCGSLNSNDYGNTGTSQTMKIFIGGPWRKGGGHPVPPARVSPVKVLV